MQQQDTSNSGSIAELSAIPERGRLVALDPGMKRVGVAVCDELQTVPRPVRTLERSSWKKLLRDVSDIVVEFDAVALIIGLPFNFDGTESPMSAEARSMARKFSLSLNLPVVLQDERATSYEAKGRIWERGVDLLNTRDIVDAKAAAIILADLIDRLRDERSRPHGR